MFFDQWSNAKVLFCDNFFIILNSLDDRSLLLNTFADDFCLLKTLLSVNFGFKCFFKNVSNNFVKCPLLLEMGMCGCFVCAILINYDFDLEDPETSNNNKRKK